jgi:hypothetical protein
MPLFFLINLIFILTVQDSFAVLEKVDQLGAPDWSQVITLFSDKHIQSDQDEQQIELFQDLLLERENNQALPFLHVYIEQPPHSYWNCVTKKIGPMTHGYKKIKIEHIDIRHYANAALYLLQPLSDSFNPWNIDGAAYYDKLKKPLIKITFEDVIQEYSTITHNIEQSFERIDVEPLLIEKIREHCLIPTISCIQAEYQQFISTLNVHNINQEASILKMARLTASDTNSCTMNLYSLTLNMFRRLVDLYILSRIIKNKKEHIALIAGTLHTQAVKSMLMDIEYPLFSSDDTTSLHESFHCINQLPSSQNNYCPIL